MHWAHIGVVTPLFTLPVNIKLNIMYVLYSVGLNCPIKKKMYTFIIGISGILLKYDFIIYFITI